MPCKIKDLEEKDIISVWFGKGHLPVRGVVRGFAGGEKDKPKFIKAWVKNSKGNGYLREVGDTFDDEPKIFYLKEEQVTKVVVDGAAVLKAMGFKKL
jgi:hypothetical protein